MGRNRPAHCCCLGTPPQARTALPWRVSAHERKQTSGTQRGEGRDREGQGRVPQLLTAPAASTLGTCEKLTWPELRATSGLQLETWHSFFVADNYPLFLPSSAHYSFSTKIWSHNLTVQLIAFPKFLCYSPCIYCMLGGQGDLACCSPWGRRESDTTE